MWVQFSTADGTMGPPNVRLPLVHGPGSDTHLCLKAVSLTAGHRGAREDTQQSQTSCHPSLGRKTVRSALNTYWLGGHPAGASSPQAFTGPCPETTSDLSLEAELSRQGLRSRSRGKIVLQWLLHMGPSHGLLL